MIAAESLRRQFGTFDGCTTKLPRSVKLFEGVGFRKTSEKPNCFDELELGWNIDAVAKDNRQQS